MALDGIGNIYVSSYGLIFKFASNGDSLWIGNAPVYAFDMTLDDSNNVYVTGIKMGAATEDYATAKFAPNGDTLWTRFYDGPGNGSDRALALAVDKNGNVYVTGWSLGNGTDYDYATIKYDANGNQLWVARYNGSGNGADFPGGLSSYPTYPLAVDVNGNAYVTGSSWNGTSLDYATIKYSSDGDTLWVARYNGPGNGDDIARALIVDGGANVFVTGQSIGNGTGFDYATIKYKQILCLAKPGDLDNDSTIALSDVVAISNYLFKSQPAPSPFCRADANADGKILLSDIVHLINFLFKSGPAPVKSRECCL